MKQTAVEWLESRLIQDNIFSKEEYELFDQAKEMEKHQIVNSYEDGYSDSDNTFELNKQYYNETFNNK